VAWQQGAVPGVLLDSPGRACYRRGSTDRRVVGAEGDVVPDRGAGFLLAQYRPCPSPGGSGGNACTRAGRPRHRNGITVVLITQQDAVERMTTGCA